MDMQDKVLDLMGKDHFAALAGLRVVHAEPGEAEVHMLVGRELLNGHGNVHGGALFTLADYAAAVASNMYGSPTIGATGSINYMRAVRGGTAVAKAKVIKRGRRMNFVNVEIYNDEGEVAAFFQGSSMLVEGPVQKLDA